MNDSDEKFDASRRDFLKLMGFSFTAATVVSCARMPVEQAIPFLNKPEEITPGVANWYATTCAGCTAACPLLVKVRDGRPIKIEGNKESPLTQGGVCAVGQATVLSLYDDVRLKGPLWQGNPVSWEVLDETIQKQLAAIKERQGNLPRGKIVLLSGTITSPTTQNLIQEWLQAYPGRHVVYEPVSLAALPEANEKSFGRRVVPHYRFDQAKVMVGLSADFLGTWISPVEFAKAYAQDRMTRRHIQFESRMSLTGSNADLRVPVAPSELGGVVGALYNDIAQRAGVGAQLIAPLQGVDPSIIKKTAEELWNHRGESLVVCGVNDVSLQLTVNALNSLLGNIGKTVDLDNPSYQSQGQEITQLVAEMNRGEISGLLLYGVNPAYDYFDTVAFQSGLKKVPLVISFSDRLDETSSLAHAVCPDHHFLESWNDHQPVASYWSMTQPTLRPLHNTRSVPDNLLQWMGRDEDFYHYLQSYWQKHLFSRQREFLTFQGFWDHVVQRGVFTTVGADSDHPSFVRRGRGGRSRDLPPVVPLTKGDMDSPLPEGQFELELYEKIAIRDGRHANNPWLQELPDPITKITWDNYVSVAPKTAKSLGLEEGDVVKLVSVGAQLIAPLQLPIQIQPGQSPRSVSIALGYGRTRCGKVGEKVGVNVFPWIAARSGVPRLGVSLEKTGRHVELAATQTHHSMEGRPIVKEASLAEFVKNPSAGNEEHEKLLTLWTERTKEGHAWGMVLDLTKCIGCSACIISCQAENNVAVVGRDEVQRRREMHWIRLDRYYNGSEDNPETVHQPMMCQHCGHAPCETVCPVLATVHSSDGLNQQVYNRCVGTRYCANNCPYKVRRFNWFDYAHNDKFDYQMNSDLEAMVLNPDIVVRSRGVMEKCSLCVQRIQEGKLQAKREGRELKDGDIQVACQQSCPSDAIVFGDLNEAQSRIAKLNQDGRFYHVLEELNVRPVVGYLTKIRNKTGDQQ